MNPDGSHSKAELTEMLIKMRLVAASFYPAACATGCHAFIEFTGLMNEFITICEKSMEKNIDFALANTHNNVALAIEPHHVQYLAEKLDCIYGPSIRGNKEIRDAFIRAMTEDE